MKSNVKFTDTPPKVRRQRYDWEAIAAKLRERPGEWALIFENDLTSLTTAFRLGGYRALPPEEFEIRTANSSRGITSKEATRLGVDPVPRRCSLYMRAKPTKKKERTMKKKAN